MGPDDEELISKAAELLARQWPLLSVGRRRRQIKEAATAGKDAFLFPVHVVLVDSDEEVLAHAKVEPFGEEALMKSVVVVESGRRRGLGRAIVEAAEAFAKENAAGYMSLLAAPGAQTFYERCGYGEDDAPERPPLLDAIDTSALENILKKRNVKEEEDHGTWMRKRLLERSSRSQVLDRATLENALHPFAPAPLVRPTAIPWERQIGPSCGLFALRCAKETLLDMRLRGELKGDEKCAGKNNKDQSSLLELAQKRGISSDGEVFDICALASLGVDGLGLTAKVLRSKDWRTVVTNCLDAGGLVLVAYDRDSRDHRPVLQNGSHAHYALIVGYGYEKNEKLLLDDDETTGLHDKDRLYVVAVHGLSRQPLVADLADLYASSAQLEAMKPRTGRASRWILPAGGIQLAERLLLLTY